MFDAIERRINSGVLKRLSNATALINAAPVTGIFDNEASGVDMGLAGFQASSPQFTCASVEIAAIEEDDPVVILSVTYRVAEIAPDGSGLTVLTLKK
jgi:hypothetical protein